jgi:hypothetical protein
MMSPVILAALLTLQSGSDLAAMNLAPVPEPTWTLRTDMDALGTRAGFELSQPTDSGYLFSVAGFGRISWPFGALEDDEVYFIGNVILIPDHLRYSDVFEAGWGYGLEASVMFARHGPTGPPHRGPGPHSPGLNAGVYISLQADTYEGDNSSEGSASFEPDDLTMYAAYVGLKVSTHMGGGSYGDAHVGIGVVRYEAVDASYSLIGPGRQTDEFLEESQEFAFESRYRFSAKLGPVALFGGLGIRIMGSPEEADSVLGNGFDAHTFWTFDVDFGVQLGF